MCRSSKARKRTLASLFLFTLATPTYSAPVQFTLAPPSVQIGFRAQALGLISIDGRFQAFTGTLTLDDSDPAVCTIALRAETASLRMPQQTMTDDATGPDLLDVTRYPEFRIDGACDGPVLRATLQLHGLKRPVTLDVTRERRQFVATGTINRAEWGMGAHPLLAGPQVRFTITAGLPAAVAPATFTPH